MKKSLSIFNYTISNAKNDVVEIHIDGDIVDASTQSFMKAYWGDDTSVSFKSFRDQIQQNPSQKYKIFINSYGGHVGDALAMHDLIKQMRRDGKTVNTIGTGIVASSGTFILMAGDDPTLTENSSFLIHNVSGSIWGDVHEIMNYAKSLEKFNNRARDFYAEFTKLSKDEITRLMDEGQFMTAQEAKELGFVTSLSGSVDFTNKIPVEKWEYDNTAVLNSYNANVKPETSITSIFKKELNDMKTTFQNFINGLKTSKPENAEAATILNTVADNMTTMLETLSADIDTEVETQVTNHLTANREQLITDITAQVVTQISAGYETRIKALEDENKDLNTEFEKKLGNQSNASNKEAAKAIGGFQD